MTTLKYASASVVPDATLGDRQIRVIANSGRTDRVGDVLAATGCKLDTYLTNPIVLADHNRTAPIGNFAPEIKDGMLQGVITFAPAGISPKADEYCGLYKSGVMKAVSVGFNGIKSKPNKNGGIDFDEWELVELSGVAVGCDPNALTIGRGFADGAHGSVWKVGASLNLPVASSAGTETWDASKAADAIFHRAGFETASPDYALARKGFLLYDAANPKLKSSYRLPFATVVDGRLMVVAEGLAQAKRLLASETVPDTTKAHAVTQHYEVKMAWKPGHPSKAKTVTVATAPKIKGLYTVASLAQLLTNLGYIHSDTVYETAYEEDASKVPAMLANALRVVADALLAMTQEEVAELLAGHDVEIEDDAVVLAAPSTSAKAFLSAFAKAGRAMSSANMEHVKALQKCMEAMSACQTKALDSHGETHDQLEAFTDHLTKAMGHLTALKKAGKPKAKPKPDDTDDAGDADGSDDDDGDPEDDDDDDDVDAELAAAAARRKRALALMEI